MSRVVDRTSWHKKKLYFDGHLMAVNVSFITQTRNPPSACLAGRCSLLLSSSDL
jgi:hypothetical protein